MCQWRNFLWLIPTRRSPQGCPAVGQTGRTDSAELSTTGSHPFGSDGEDGCSGGGPLEHRVALHEPAPGWRKPATINPSAFPGGTPGIEGNCLDRPQMRAACRACDGVPIAMREARAAIESARHRTGAVDNRTRWPQPPTSGTITVELKPERRSRCDSASFADRFQHVPCAPLCHGLQLQRTRSRR